MFNASARWRPFRASLLLRETQTWGSRPRLYDIAASRLKEMRPLERIRARRGATRRGKTEQSGRSDQNQRFVSLAVPAASGGGARLRTTSVIGHTPGPYSFDLMQKGSLAEFLASNSTRQVIHAEHGYTLIPGRFVLGLTTEYVERSAFRKLQPIPGSNDA